MLSVFNTLCACTRVVSYQPRPPHHRFSNGSCTYPWQNPTHCQDATSRAVRRTISLYRAASYAVLAS